MSDVGAEIAERLARLKIPFNSAGIDPYGISKEHLQRAGVFMVHAYRRYFRTQCLGVEHVPKEGRCMLVANHSGGYALDAGMLATACFLELEPPRLAHAMLDRFVSDLPFLSKWANRLGQLAGLPQHARRLLLEERLLMVFPEGVRGTAKLFHERHSLVRFGTGFMRLAIETQSPIVPVAVVGGGEAVPTVVNLYRLGKLLGAPYIPLTPYLVPLPLPARLRIVFGEPMHFDSGADDSEADIEARVEQVRQRVAELLDVGKASYTAFGHDKPFKEPHGPDGHAEHQQDEAEP